MEQYFYSISEMVNYLIDNEGKVLVDGYGRKWMFKESRFWFKNIDELDFKEGTKCLHLFGMVKPIN